MNQLISANSLSPINSKVVVAPSATAILLSLANKEGLISENSDGADGCLAMYSSQQFPDWMIPQVLEQVVLFEQIHLMGFFPTGSLEGEFMETGSFFSAEKSSDTGVITEIHPSILNGILKSSNINPTPFEDPSIMERWGLAIKEQRAWEDEFNEKFPSKLQVFTNRALDRNTSEDRYRRAESILEKFEEFQPIASALNGYLEVAATAHNQLAHMMTPLMPLDHNSLFRPLAISDEANSPTVLLRLTCSRLGVLPFAQSLRQTLELGRDPATIALRVKIQEWTNSLTEDNGSETEKIQKEISNALSYMKVAGTGSSVSNFCTYISLPVGLFSLVSNFATAMGWACTVAGSVGLAISQAVSRKYLWASFGTSNRS